MRTPALITPSSSSCPVFSAALRSSPTLTFPLTDLRLPNSKIPELRIQASSMIDKDFPVAEKPPTFLREVDENNTSKSSVRARFEKMIREAQDSVYSAIEAADGGAKFKEDVSRPGGGGGMSRVLQDGAVWEKAGVNVSVVYGLMPPDAYRTAKPSQNENATLTVPFFAAGISSVLHPKNPFAPTLHFNYRYFETDAPKGQFSLKSHRILVPTTFSRSPKTMVVRRGTDLTPAYIFEEDVKHFHQVQKAACDKFNSEFYPHFKKWCDDYFYIKHCGERRGLGGIFFDDLNAYDQQMLFSFLLVYDRGTTFGLKTGGRIESILVSLPLTARWEYDHQPEGSEEWKLLDACINPKDWI
ncbi:Coproporphyrinogen III oxidase [Perilla frutescens var. frutescens]|nr:Coproporphyrinogen III oxidase [Perilla frutescens var. frutescens]